MARKGKWIDGITPGQPVGEVGRRVLGVRLGVFWHWLPLAAEQSDEDTEYVHQLRVATRRAMAPLKIFRPLMSPETWQRMKDQLRDVRRAAGEARDWDVLSLRLKESAKSGRFSATASDADAGSFAAVLQQIGERRAAAQPPIREAYRRLAEDGFARQIQDLLDELRYRFDGEQAREPTFEQAARRHLAAEVPRVFGTWCGPMTDPDELHQFRIRGKKLRYTMEVFAGAFAQEFRDEVYPIVEQLQKYLGRITDHTMAERRFGELLASAEDDTAPLLMQEIELHRKAATEADREFRQWWTADRADALRRRLAPFC